MSTPPSTPGLDELDGRLWGSVVRPGDPDYDSARTLWNAMFDRRPSAIARCHGVADVVAVVRYAREHGLPFTVRAGGHGAAGDCLQDGVLALDLSPMSGVFVDAVQRTAVVQAGCRLGVMDRELQLHGLAVPSGTVPDTGVCGLTLGGGVGWMMRTFGATVDSVLSMDLVTVDGGVLRVDRESDPELFWGLCGGGGNFGIVTSIQFQAQAIGTTVLAGGLFFTEDHATVLRMWRDFMADAPHELNSTISLSIAPRSRFFGDFSGQLLTVLNVAYIGDLDEGRALIAPLKEQVTPFADMVKETSYLDLQEFLARGLPPDARAYEKGGLLPALEDDLIDAMVAAAHAAPQGSPGTPDTTSIAISALGGRFTELAAAGATSMPRDDSAFIWLSMSLWLDAEDDARWIAYPRELTRLIEPWSEGRIYLNQDSGGSVERVRSGMGAERFDRLVALKDVWDPTNVLRFNKNIPPSSSSEVTELTAAL